MLNQYIVGKSLLIGDVEPALYRPMVYVSEREPMIKVKEAIKDAGGDIVVSDESMLPLRTKSMDSSMLNFTGDPYKIINMLKELARVSRDRIIVVGWQPDKGWGTTPLFTSELGVIKNKVKAFASNYLNEYLEFSDRYVYVIYMSDSDLGK